jgi:hypothetical protein
MTKESGGFKRKFATDGFFYVQAFSTIISTELFDRFSSLVPFGYHRSCDTSTDENRAAERNIRIDDDRSRFFRGTLSGEWIKSQGYAFCIAIDPSKVRFQEGFYSKLTGATDVNELTVFLNKQIQSVGSKAFLS